MEDHADAVRLLTAYSPPNAYQRELRRDYLEHLATHADGTRRQCRPDHLTASALVVDPASGLVLLGLHAKVKLWLQMGGHIEEGDATLAAAAMREAKEESGIEGLRLWSDVPIALDRHAAPCAPDARYHLDVQFLALAPQGAQPAVSHEQLELRWSRFDALPEPTDGAVRGLTAAAVAVLSRQAR